MESHRSAQSSRRPSFDANRSEHRSSQSRFSSVYDARRITAKIDEDTRYRAIVKHLHAKACAMQWMIPGPVPPGIVAGVMIRKTMGDFATEPANIDNNLLAAVKKINPGVALTMSTEGTAAVFDAIDPYETELFFQNGSQVQIFDSLAELAQSSTIKKFQYAALLRNERVLLVWHDELGAILSHAMTIESRMLALIWGTAKSPFVGTNPFATGANSYVGSEINLPLEKEKDVVVEVEEAPKDGDAEAGPRESLSRPLILTSSIFTGFATMLILVLVVGLGSRALALQTVTDGFYIRLALLLTEPMFFFLGLFFAVVVCGNIFQMIGPITSVKSNSRFYSAIKPNLSQARALGFRPPPITIQMPIYTESLEGVVKPTVQSLNAAISYYESRGGTCRIFMNDDGMAKRSEEENKEFIEFYEANNIGWVARPGHNQDGFQRRGKFKKASNMNFALNIANRVEDTLQAAVDARLEKEDSIPVEEQHRMYKEALQAVLDADPRAKAGGDIRMGEIILIVDSDTRVPEDCLMYGAAEMFLSPEVAIIQHSTGVMQVSWDYFENAITYFTNLVYTAIRFAVGSGEIAPFVGHNAFLRWQAVQSVGNPPEEDGYVAFWSESHVSEDFDIALRLQVAGNVVRLASYHGDGFKEGVSLTLYDELNRWEKYAFGCNELVFNPIWTWLWRGPITPLFRKFCFSNIQLSSKLTIIGYISSYYAIGSAVPFGILNYFLIGWFNGEIDKYYVESWKVFISLIFVFNLMSNVALAILRYRVGDMSLLRSLFENFKWMPFFVIFFGGLSFHVLCAILSHMFGIDMNWGATSKEKDDSNFFAEMPKIFSRFKWMYMVMVPLIGAMIYLARFAPRGWEIDGFTAIVPMASIVFGHCLFPFALNPSLMVFNY